MYFHTDNMRTIDWLASVLSRAQLENLPIRFDVDYEGGLKVKLGGGMWTSPLPSTPDASRDGQPEHGCSTPITCPLVAWECELLNSVDTKPVYGVCKCHPDFHVLNDACIGWLPE